MEEEEAGGVQCPRTQAALIAERQAIVARLAEMGDSSDSETEGDVPVAQPAQEEPAVCPFKTASPGDEEEASEDVAAPKDRSNSTANDEESEGDDEEDDEEEEARSPVDTRVAYQIQKWVPDHKDKIPKNGLPEGWSIVLHKSGMPLFYHKFTRVVTHSRPYQISASARDHEIPLAAVPCLYRQAMNKYQEEKETGDEVKKEADNPAESMQTSEAAEEVTEKPEEPKAPVFDKDHPENRMLTTEEYREYCSARYKFKEITVNRYKDPRDRQHNTQKKRANIMLKKQGFEMDYDQLKARNTDGDVLLTSESGSVLIDLTPLDKSRRGTGSKKPYLMNPMGKTSVTVLNEFTQRMVKGQLSYTIDDTRNVSCPYKATAMITMSHDQLASLEGFYKESLTVLHEISKMDDVTSTSSTETKKFAIGRGLGANKKNARLAAARDAMSKLIPKLRINDDFVCEGLLRDGDKKDFEQESRNLLKKVPIDSPNVVSWCQRFGIPKPYALLKDAVSRSVRWNGLLLECKKEIVGNTMVSRVTLTLGDLSAEAEAVGAKPAQQFAAQALFKVMHPELINYGSFLELYGRFEDKEKMELAKKHHDEVVRLPDTGNLLEPNHNVLTKLVSEMGDVVKVFPPRAHLFGQEPVSSMCRGDMKTENTQWSVEDTMPTRADPPPPPPPSANYFQPIAPAPVAPLHSGSQMRQPAFMPIQEYRQHHQMAPHHPSPQRPHPQYRPSPQRPYPSQFVPPPPSHQQQPPPPPPQQQQQHPHYPPNAMRTPPPKRGRFEDPSR